MRRSGSTLARPVALALLCACLRASAARAQAVPAAAVAAVDQELARLGFNGSVLVARGGSVLYRRDLGYADMEAGVPVGPQTRFELASLAKPLTALVVLQLVEQGKLRLDGRVADYVSEFTRADARAVTVHHLLSHTSGLQDFVGLSCDFAGWTDKQFLEALAKTPLQFPPGARFQYASSTYVLLRLLVERVTGRSYEAVLQEQVFAPAGMRNSGVVHTRRLLPGRARGYVRTDSGYRHAAPIANSAIFLGAASIYSTAEDLLKWDQALYGEALLSAASKARMFRAVQPPYGYGWFVSDSPARGAVVSHGGDIFGFTTLIERRLRDRALLVVLSNVQDADREAVVGVLERTLAGPATKPASRRRPR
jgi:CubicO group peptidase (beta-lactamase class C family)